MPPSCSAAHACKAPHATFVADEMPETITGTLLFVVVPSPSMPYELYPQHFTEPSVSEAQEKCWPASKLTAVVIP